MNRQLHLNKPHSAQVIIDYFKKFNVSQIQTKSYYTFVLFDTKAAAMEVLKTKPHTINGVLTEVAIAIGSLDVKSLTPEEQAVVDGQQVQAPAVAHPQQIQPQQPVYVVTQPAQVHPIYHARLAVAQPAPQNVMMQPPQQFQQHSLFGRPQNMMIGQQLGAVNPILGHQVNFIHGPQVRQQLGVLVQIPANPPAVNPIQGHQVNPIQVPQVR